MDMGNLSCKSWNVAASKAGYCTRIHHPLQMQSPRFGTNTPSLIVAPNVVGNAELPSQALNEPSVAAPRGGSASIPSSLPANLTRYSIFAVPKPSFGRCFTSQRVRYSPIGK
jgi:hypothetical protein